MRKNKIYQRREFSRKKINRKRIGAYGKEDHQLPQKSKKTSKKSMDQIKIQIN